MISSARTYVNKTGEHVPYEGKIEIIPLKTLIEKNYISKIIYPDNNKRECDGAVVVTNTNGKYTYEGYLNCGDYLSDNISEIYDELDKSVENKAIEVLKENTSLLPATNGTKTLNIENDLHLDITDPMNPDNNMVTGNVKVNNGTSIIAEVPTGGETVNTGTKVDINGQEYQVISDIVVKGEDNNVIYANGTIGGNNDEGEEEPTYTDYSLSEGVNKPKLLPGMTAIKWDGVTEQVVDNPNTDTSWYNYSNQEWANAKTSDGSYWVWIPRYAYKIISGYHSNTAGEISIKFLTDDTNKASDGTTIILSNDSQNNYVLHPAFTFGNKELTGIWIAKFETSGTVSSLDSKPNVASLRNISIGSMFTATRNMETNNKYGWGLASGLSTDGTFTTDNNNVDVHMMKNSEWGAITYLSQSSFGKYGNTMYTAENKEIYQSKSSTYITGSSNGIPGSNPTYTQCSYNNITDRGNGTGSCGGGASTTGNIYGIYDTAGGSREYIMANYNDLAGSSGLTPSSINNKYIDRYTAYDNTKYGDAVYEISSTYSGDNSWYRDASGTLETNYPWFSRGGVYANTYNAGINNFSAHNGAANAANSWRIIILTGNGL
jgi:hypothetical protein